MDIVASCRNQDQDKLLVSHGGFERSRWLREAAVLSCWLPIWHHAVHPKIPQAAIGTVHLLKTGIGRIRITVCSGYSQSEGNKLDLGRKWPWATSRGRVSLAEVWSGTHRPRTLPRLLFGFQWWPWGNRPLSRISPFLVGSTGPQVGRRMRSNFLPCCADIFNRSYWRSLVGSQTSTARRGEHWSWVKI